MRGFIIALGLFYSGASYAMSPAALGQTILNACGTNVTDPICYDMSFGRQYVDITYRHYLSQYLQEPGVVLVVGATNTMLQKRLTLVLSRKKGLGAPEITIRKDEALITFHWRF